MMELRHIRYFVAVAEEEHLGKAARRLHVSPPPLSKQIHELEDELGVSLFAHVGRGLKLTDAGRVFLEGARAVLAEVSRAVATAQAASRGDYGRLVIGFTETGTYAAIIPEIVARMRVRHPSVSLELLPMNWSEQIPALRDGRIQVAFCNDQPNEPGLRSTVLVAERIVLALPRDHPLARLKTISVKLLRDEPFVWIPRSALPDYLQESVTQLAARDLRLNVAIEARSTATRLSLVAAGMGLTPVVESTRAFLPKQVTLRPFSDAPLRVHSVLAWRTADNASPVLRSLREITHAVARSRRSRPQAAAVE